LIINRRNDLGRPGKLAPIGARNGRFRFTLEVVQPRFGRLIRQSAVFREANS
jgi:hypothetical protein